MVGNRELGFIRYFEPQDNDHLGYDRILYHYTSFDHGVSDLKNARFKLSRPTEFNDPLDSTGYYRGNPTYEVFFRYFANTLFKDYVKDCIESKVPKRVIWQELRNYVAEAFSRFCLKSHPLVDNLLASFCGGGDDDFHTDTLLWSHYADSCRGIRIGVLFPSDGPYVIRPIKYVKRLPALDFKKLTALDCDSDEFDNLLRDYHGKMICSKHVAWKYEQEFRLITNVYGTNVTQNAKGLWFAKIPLQYIKSVDFGCRACGGCNMKADEIFLRQIWRLHKETGIALDCFRKTEIQVGRYGFSYIQYKDVARRLRRRYKDIRFRREYDLHFPRWLNDL